MQHTISAITQQAITNKVFPGAVIGIIANNTRTILPFGSLEYENADPVSADTAYDLASITKPIPTMCLLLMLIEQGKLSLDTPVINYLPELSCKDRESITIRHLITYTLAFDMHAGSSFTTTEDLLKNIYAAELAFKPGTKFLYTNLGAYLAGFVIEKATGKKLDILAKELLFEPLGMAHTTFTPQKETVVPAGDGVPQGEVHDETANMMRKSGIIAGHAGLFSTADDLLTFAQMLLNKGELNGQRFFSPQTVEHMHTNQLANINEVWGLGWAIPGGVFDFFGGKVSPQAFGMTGFTGTSFLVDPVKNRALVVLANATFPVRKNDKEIINSVRRALADAVFA